MLIKKILKLFYCFIIFHITVELLPVSIILCFTVYLSCVIFNILNQTRDFDIVSKSVRCSYLVHIRCIICKNFEKILSKFE